MRNTKDRDRRRLRSWLFAISLCAFGTGDVARALSVVETSERLIWQQIAWRADFIGEVECITAGGIVARYRVLATWKGRPTAGDELLIEIPPFHITGPAYPLALVGQRFVVAGFAAEARHGSSGTPTEALVPQRWRVLPADYRLPKGSGIAMVDDPAELQVAFGSVRTHPQALRRDIDAFLQSPRAELELLQALALNAFAGSDRMSHALHARASAFAASTGAAQPSRTASACEQIADGADGDARERCVPDDPVLAPILAASSAFAVAELLLQHAGRADPARRSPYLRVLAGGGAETRRALRSHPLAVLGDGNDMRDLRKRLLREPETAQGGTSPTPPGKPDEITTPPDSATLHEWRTRLTGRQGDSWHSG